MRNKFFTGQVESGKKVIVAIINGQCAYLDATQAAEMLQHYDNLANYAKGQMDYHQLVFGKAVKDGR